MRGAPQRGLAELIVWIRFWTSVGTDGRPSPVSQCAGQSANWTKLWRARPTRVGRKIAIAGDGFGARAAAKEAGGGVPGSQRAEQPEFEDSHEGRGAGKRGVRTFPCTLPRLAASSTLSMRTDFLVGTGYRLSRNYSFRDSCLGVHLSTGLR